MFLNKGKLLNKVEMSHFQNPPTKEEKEKEKRETKFNICKKIIFIRPLKNQKP